MEAGADGMTIAVIADRVYESARRELVLRQDPATAMSSTRWTTSSPRMACRWDLQRARGWYHSA